MIYCKELDKSFTSKEAMFKEVKKNLPEILRLKMEKVYKSCEKGLGISIMVLDLNKTGDASKVSFEMDDEHYYIATNTTYILDSHGDFHDRGLWNDSVVSEQGKNYLTLDHSLKMSDIAVKKNKIEQLIAEIPFSALGKKYEGDTQALIYKFRKDSLINETAKEWLESGDDIEASVRMRYDDIDFALDSNHPDDKEYKTVYDAYLPLIANKSDFEYIPYFFVIKKATNVRESALVIAGSNPATGAIRVSEKQEIKEIDPAESSQLKKSNFYNLIH